GDRTDLDGHAATIVDRPGVVRQAPTPCIASGDGPATSDASAAAARAIVECCNHACIWRSRSMGEMGMDEVRGWFAGRIPDDWFTGALEVTADREEILVVGELAEVKAAKGASEAEAAAAVESRVDGFREETRATRMRIADEAQRRFRRQV